MWTAWVVCYGSLGSWRYLAHNHVKATRDDGWRPRIWTKDVGAAEKWSSQVQAKAYADSYLPGNDFAIVPCPQIEGPEHPVGGTPIQMAVAA